MEYNDNFNPVYNDNDYIDDFMDNRKTIDDTKKMDIGYNAIFRMRPRSDGTLKKTKIDVYTSGDIGSSIRDAETGDYFRSKVGSADEDLFFKVGLATGECRSKNKSSTLFYLSPNHYMSHMQCELDEETIARWEAKRNHRTEENNMSSLRADSMASVVVN
jgi:hypothetical protein